MGRPRPWLAALLAFLYPGLGHLYLREWARSLLWFVLGVGTVLLAIPQGPLSDASITDPQSMMDASEAMTAEASTVGLIVVVTVFAFSVVDAYTIARGARARRAREAAGEVSQDCPVCGRELDDDLDFCHWCTTRFEPRSGE
ncbi:zinc ribbon domain-containing protein [Salinarchaeum chitinilyticum]